MSEGSPVGLQEETPPQATRKHRRASLFEVGFPLNRDRGSSIVSVPSIIPSSQLVPHQKVRYENTYKMKPEKRFDIVEVKEIIEETLASTLQDVKYEAIKCKALCKSLSHTICERVKLLDFGRFKIVSLVNIGEIKGQGVRIASRFLWNEKHDNWVDGVFTNPDIFAVAVVFGVYQE